MKTNSMKTHLAFMIVAACLAFASSEIAAQETQGETLHGVIESVDGNTITVNHRRKSRTFTLNDKAQNNYISFLKAKEVIEPGFFIRAGVDSKGQCNQRWVTLPRPEASVNPSAEMLT